MNTAARHAFLSFGLFMSFLFVGCAGSASSRPGPYVKPGLVMVPADQAKYYGGGESGVKTSPTPSFAATDTRSVLTDSEVTAIQFNRYADPAHPRELMHEAHIVYRRDLGPSWRLTPPSVDQQILVGPQIADGRGEIKGLASPELDSYLREQRTTLHRQEETLTKVTETMRQLAEQQKHMAEQLSRSGSNPKDGTIAPDAAGAPSANASVMHLANRVSGEKPPETQEKEPTEIPER